MAKSYLFVIAHSDDELLGAGATMKKLIDEGNKVYVACMSNAARTREKSIPETMLATHKELGVEETFICNCQAMQFGNVDHFSLVGFIEDCIRKSDADIIFTHSDTDLHPDHRATNELVLEAFRLPQRGIENIKKIEAVYAIEVTCSSSWSLEPFNADTYVEVTDEQIQEKIRLLKMYDFVIRDAPHPRSEENIKALATFRGCQSGYRYAEAFKTLFRLEV